MATHGMMSMNIEEKVAAMKRVSSGLGQAATRLFSAQGASGMLGTRRAVLIQLLAGGREFAHSEAVP
jgi:NADP-dependent 3-hydroxy acid dehydrogenase YdfG